MHNVQVMKISHINFGKLAFASVNIFSCLAFIILSVGGANYQFHNFLHHHDDTHSIHSECSGSHHELEEGDHESSHEHKDSPDSSCDTDSCFIASLIRGVVHFTWVHILPDRTLISYEDAAAWKCIHNPDPSNFLLLVHERAPPASSFSLL